MSWTVGLTPVESFNAHAVHAALAVPVAHPGSSSSSSVEDVGLKDTPLRSLYPDVPRIAPVRLGSHSSFP